MSKASAKKNPPVGWHPADIKAALEKKGYTLGRIARENGYARSSPGHVFRGPWLNMEQIVGKIIGVHPMEIWPDRYMPNGQPTDRRTRRGTS